MAEGRLVMAIYGLYLGTFKRMIMSAKLFCCASAYGDVLLRYVKDEQLKNKVSIPFMLYICTCC